MAGGPLTHMSEDDESRVEKIFHELAEFFSGFNPEDLRLVIRETIIRAKRQTSENKLNET